jgi:murein DD-endopeptidase MepM/ murein hydrolase activator NlpD
VLRSPDRLWLNWRDTFGAPRLRLQPDGVWRQTGFHQGIDIFAEEGTPVVAMRSGTILRVGWTFYSGWRVGVRGEDGKYYFYAHLRRFAPGIRVGGKVRAGTRLGEVGNSGYGPQGTADQFPPHLHLGVEGRGGWENPQPLLKELYSEYVTKTRATEGRLRELVRQIRLLTAQASVPGAATVATLMQQVQTLEEEQRRLQSDLLVD